MHTGYTKWTGVYLAFKYKTLCSSVIIHKMIYSPCARQLKLSLQKCTTWYIFTSRLAYFSFVFVCSYSYYSFMYSKKYQKGTLKMLVILQHCTNPSYLTSASNNVQLHKSNHTHTACSIILTLLMDPYKRKVVISNNKQLFLLLNCFCLRHKVIVVQSHSMLASVPAEAFNWLACDVCLGFQHGYMICIFHMAWLPVLHKSPVHSECTVCRILYTTINQPLRAEICLYTTL